MDKFALGRVFVDNKSFGGEKVIIVPLGDSRHQLERYEMVKALRVTAYHLYLGSAFWREKSQYILRRANYTCEKCGIRPATEVHHLTYKRVFQEHPSDLLAVCRQCHAEIHWRQPANDNQIQFVFDFPTADEEDEEGD